MATRKVGTQTVRMFHFLAQGADTMQEAADSTEEGRAYFLMATVLFNAFQLESYLQHVGESLFPTTWRGKASDHPKPGEWLSPKEKLKTIAKHCNLMIDWNKRPFQSFTEIFKVRNDLAHAQTVVVPAYVQATPSDQRPQSNLPQSLSLDSKLHIEKWREDTNEIISTITVLLTFLVDVQATLRLVRYLVTVSMGLLPWLRYPRCGRSVL